MKALLEPAQGRRPGFLLLHFLDIFLQEILWKSTGPN